MFRLVACLFTASRGERGGGGVGIVRLFAPEWHSMQYTEADDFLNTEIGKTRRLVHIF